MTSAETVLAAELTGGFPPKYSSFTLFFLADHTVQTGRHHRCGRGGSHRPPWRKRSMAATNGAMRRSRCATHSSS